MVEVPHFMKTALIASILTNSKLERNLNGTLRFY